jgi:hypothetical protein
MSGSRNCPGKSEGTPAMSLGSAGVLLLGNFVIGQQCFQDCDPGLDFGHVNVQLGYYLPDLVIT